MEPSSPMGSAPVHAAADDEPPYKRETAKAVDADRAELLTVDSSSSPESGVTGGPLVADATAAAVFVLAVGGALTFSFLCSIFESVLLSVSRGHVQAMVNAGSRTGKILSSWKSDDIERPIAAILILNTIAHTVGATVAGASFKNAFDLGSASANASALFYFSAVFTLAVLLLTEIIPKTLGVTFANRLASPVTFAVDVLVTAMKPVLFITTWLSRLLTKGHRKPVTSIEEIRLLAALGRQEGDVGPRLASFIEGVASLKELTVHDIMVPRVKIAYLSGQKSFEENLSVVRESGHSRFLLTPTGDLDDVAGVILAKELLFVEHDLEDGQEVDLKTVAQRPLVFPETKPLDAALRLFQSERKHLAVVVDEYGGTQGLVTLEDVLEEIVGEIVDETDRVEKLIRAHKDGVTYTVAADAETRKLFKTLGIEEKVEFVSVGGLIADLLGHVPRVGDVGEWPHFKFKVTEANSRRAEVIEIEVREESVEEAAASAQSQPEGADKA
ncbi:MAG: hemolysin family protein [Myxococcota bacterium]